MSTATLYDYWRSSASYRVRIALNLAGIAYESISINLLEAEHKSREHLARHPQGLVPVLEIDGHEFTHRSRSSSTLTRHANKTGYQMTRRKLPSFAL